MLFRICLTLALVFHFNNAQDMYKEMVYFPEETPAASSQSENRAEIPGNINLTEIRGTTMYEKYVEQLISGGIAKLTLAINKVLLQGRSGSRDNVVFAPMSIGAALALIHLGSNGKTFQEITNILDLASGLDVQSKSVQVHEQFGRMIIKLETNSGFELGHQINLAQGIFVQENYPIRPLYQETAQQLYASETYHVNFESRPAEAQKKINKWVSERTHGKIKDILAETPIASTKVIIASAMYFKALWENPFFEGITARRPFYSNGRHHPSTAHVDMMANGGDFPYYKDLTLNCEVMGFPYKGNKSVMYVVMPFNSDTETLKEFENVLTAGYLQQLADNTRSTGAVVLFPKMKIESTVDLKGPLRTLGLRSLFDPAQANLALLSPGDQAPFKSPLAQPIVGSGQNYPTPSYNIPVSSDSPNLNYPTANRNTISSTQSATESATMNTNDDSVLIFSRLGKIGYQQTPIQSQSTQGEYTGRKINFASRINTGNTESLDNLRQTINQQSTDNSYQNPGLYADKIIHKVYMDITETGTEAAASTSVTLSRDGNRVTFRVDSPFLFFIRHEDTKTILFWGSVNTPTPNF